MQRRIEEKKRDKILLFLFPQFLRGTFFPFVLKLIPLRFLLIDGYHLDGISK